MNINKKLGFTLAGATHRDHTFQLSIEKKGRMSKNIGKHAFTLAEVLITLGIIGVVAALTLPSLIAKHQNQVHVNRLKKMISMLENGVRQAAADESVDINKTELFSVLNMYAYHSDEIEKRFKPINKYFKILGKDEIDHARIKGLITFADGSAINYGWPQVLGFVIDTNGRTKPNIFGRDMFQLVLDEKGLIHDWSDCSSDDSERPVIKYYNCGQCESILSNNPNANDCYLYRIRRDGWQMKY